MMSTKYLLSDLCVVEIAKEVRLKTVPSLIPQSCPIMAQPCSSIRP